MILNYASLVFTLVVFLCFYALRSGFRAYFLAGASLIYILLIDVNAAIAVAAVSILLYIFSSLISLKNIRVCIKNLILGIFVIVSPYVTTNDDETVYNRVHEIADFNGLNFDSTDYSYDEMAWNDHVKYIKQQVEYYG